MANWATKTAQSCRFALHSIRKIRPLLTEHAAELVVQVLQLLDWTTVLLFWLDFQHLQSDLNKWYRMQQHNPLMSLREPTLHWCLCRPNRPKRVTRRNPVLRGSLEQYDAVLNTIWASNGHWQPEQQLDLWLLGKKKKLIITIFRVPQNPDIWRQIVLKCNRESTTLCFLFYFFGASLYFLVFIYIFVIV